MDDIHTRCTGQSETRANHKQGERHSVRHLETQSVSSIQEEATELTDRKIKGRLSVTKNKAEDGPLGNQTPVIKSKASCEIMSVPSSQIIPKTYLSRAIEEVVLQVSHDRLVPVVQSASFGTLSSSSKVCFQSPSTTVCFRNQICVVSPHCKP